VYADVDEATLSLPLTASFAMAGIVTENGRACPSRWGFDATRPVSVPPADTIESADNRPRSPAPEAWSCAWFSRIPMASSSPGLFAPREAAGEGAPQAALLH